MHIDQIPAATPCSACDHFAAGDRCSVWKATVPPEAQAAGCEQFEDEVPF